MERNDLAIKNSIEKIIFLLRNNEEERWASVLEDLLNKFLSKKEKKEKVDVVKDIIQIYRGGMGSFIDLVLHKNSRWLIEENNELDALRHALYNLCLNYC